MWSTNYQALYVLLCLLSLCWSDVSRSQCGNVFRGRCLCGKTDDPEPVEFLVNCTNTGFSNTSVLEHLPPNTEMLIFNGNDIPILPWNVFGNDDNTPKLRVVDMSNNRIQEIRGKAYHHVGSVERLILNHNELSLSLPTQGVEDHRHPRMFSNFVNLKALHLTNAFKDNSPSNLANDLHDIFINSNLSHIIKLHLEQNELTGFVDQMIFCDLPALMDLHLGDNLLRGLHFNLTCLRHLRFVDLQRNRITRLSKVDLAVLDSFPARGQSLTIDISGNPLCDCSALQEWLKTTKVIVRRKEYLKCDDSSYPSIGNDSHEAMSRVSCTSLHRVLTSGSSSNTNANSGSMSKTAAFIIAFLSFAVFGLLITLIYVKRMQLQNRLSPLLETVSRKVHYTTIGHQDDEEVHV